MSQILSPEEVAYELQLAAQRRAEELAEASGYSIETGAPLLNLFGARPAPAPAAQRFSPATLRGVLNSGVMAGQAARLGLSPTVVPTAPGPVDLSYVGINSNGLVAAGASQVITVVCQTIFKPQRLNVPASLAQYFTIDNLLVGNVPLSAAAGSVPAESFVSDAVMANVKKITANPGVGISITVTNIDGAAHPFRATLFGESSQPDGCRS